MFQLYEYGAVPPEPATVALPEFAPKQPTFVWSLKLLESAEEGCVMVALLIVEQPFASVIVQVHVPATKFEAVALVCTGVVFQLYE